MLCAAVFYLKHLDIQWKHLDIQWKHLYLQWKHLDIQWKHINLQWKHLGIQWKQIYSENTKHLDLQWKHLGIQWKHLDIQCMKGKHKDVIYSRLSLSRIPRDTLKHFEISVPRLIRVERVRKTINWTTTFNKWICNLTPEVRNIYKIMWKRGKIAP